MADREGLQSICARSLRVRIAVGELSDGIRHTEKSGSPRRCPWTAPFSGVGVSGPGRRATSALSHAPIHPSAWKGDSQKVTVRDASIRRLWWHLRGSRFGLGAMDDVLLHPLVGCLPYKTKHPVRRAHGEEKGRG